MKFSDNLIKVMDKLLAYTSMDETVLVYKNDSDTETTYGVKTKDATAILTTLEEFVDTYEFNCTSPNFQYTLSSKELEQVRELTQTHDIREVGDWTLVMWK